MSLTLIVPPAEEPVALADLKAFLKVDGAEEDGLIASLGLAARLHLEALTGRVLVTQGWRIRRDAWPRSGRLDLPVGPVRSLDAVTVAGAQGPVALPLGRFSLDGAALPPRLAWTPGPIERPAVPAGGIAIDVTAGYGDAGDVPAPLIQAIRLLAAHWFEVRVPVTERAAGAVPRGVEALIAPYIARRAA